MAAGCGSSAAVLVLCYCQRQCVASLLPTMVEGGGCAVMVDAGVMVGVVAAMMAGKKEREKKYHNTVQFIILS